MVVIACIYVIQIDLPNWSQLFTVEKDAKASKEEVCHGFFNYRIANS